jgi:hypothetical protein
MTTITADYYRRSALSTHGSPAASTTSTMILKVLAETKTAAGQTASSLPARAFADLARVAQECSEPGWDGYGARPITQEVRERAQAFLDDLPLWMQAPDIVPEADGQIAIEWYIAAEHVLSISIGDTGPLHYAARFGHEDEVHGVKAFDGVAIPVQILQLIDKLLQSPAAVEPPEPITRFLFNSNQFTVHQPQRGNQDEIPARVKARP